jgi:glycosyltransferase involved in cell wall biosynthesis
MDPNVKVTIGIPVYNAGKYLKNAIDSVLAQTYPNFELLISLDGVSDNSAEIVRCFNDDRIHLIEGKENRGIAYILNQQVKLAQGYYYARMDADDIMFPDRIDTQLRYMLENPDIDVVGSQAAVIDENNRIIGLRKSDTYFTSQTIREKILFIHPTVFGKTNWFLENPYSVELEGVEDFYLWNTTFSKSKFYVLSDTLLFYRDPPLSAINTYLKRQKQVRRALQKLKSNSLLNLTSYYQLVFKSNLKSAVYLALWKLKLTRVLFSHRNSSLPSVKSLIYNDILKEIIS